MRKKQLLSSFIATTMFLNVFTTSVFAQTESEFLSSSTQTSSVEETIYVDSYSNTARSIDFSDNWKFFLGDGGSSAPDFNDSSWRSVDLPHDYSIEQEYSPSYEAESGYLPGGVGWYRKSFTLPKDWENKKIQIDFGGVYMNATIYLNGEELGFHPYGYTAFSFELPKELLKFDGENVLAVKVDHKTPSSRWYSGSGIYRAVGLTITNETHIAQYGTYITTPKLKDSNGKNGETVIETTLQNDTDSDVSVSLKHTIYEGMSKNYKDGKEISSISGDNIVIPANETIKNQLVASVSNPKLWSTENPNMYFVRTEVIKDGKVIDTYDTDFGYRYIEFGKEFGFKLNGVNTKFKGVCMHHDQGALGSEAWYRAMERQVEILKEMGTNAIRVTHNPAAKEFIEICNEKGMLVIDETFDTWVMPKNGNRNDYSAWFEKKIGQNNKIVGGSPNMTWAEFDTKAMVHQDKNSPAVVMYSLGNEIFEGTANDRSREYPDIARKLCTWVQEIDSTRPPTFGQNSNNIAIGKLVGKVLAEFGGVSGLNYSWLDRYDEWNGESDLLVYNSETASAVNSRGVYDRKVSNGDAGKGDRLLTSYDKSAVSWGATASDAWMRTMQRDGSMGEFVWTGFDYIGEPTPWNGTSPGAQGGWPSPKSSYFGIIDTNGLPKDSYYLYQSMWNDSVNTLHILPTWNRNDIVIDDSGNVEVVVYSDAAKVKLFLDDTQVAEATSKEYTTNAGYKHRIWQGGENDKDRYNHKKLYATFEVPYKEGTLKAVAYDEQGRVISETKGRNVVKTTGNPSKIRMTSDRDSIKADGDDLSYITIDITDSNGNIVNSANNKVTLSIEGDGKIIGVDNGRQIDHTSYQSLTHSAGAGQIVAIVQSTKDSGQFTVKAQSNGLSPSSVTVKTTKVDDNSGQTNNSIVSYDISRYHYVKLGNKPQLPTTVKVMYKNGKTVNKDIVWNEYDSSLINKEGSFFVNGVIKGTDTIVGANITMIGEIAGLLNYSAAIQKNARSVNLPATRPVILPDGSIISAEFPVQWDTKNINFDEIKTHTVNGVSQVFGKNIPVTATIRVAEGQINVGANVASSVVKLEQNPNGDGNINVLVDGKTNFNENAIWKSSSSNKNSNITFEYATVQALRQVSVYYYTDGANIKPPKQITLKWSPTGQQNLTPLDATASDIEEISSVNGKTVYRVNYVFEPVEALVIQLNLTNDDASNSQIGLTEVGLNLAERSFPVASEDILSKISINGIDADEISLQKRTYETEALVVESIDIESDNNTAFNVLPELEGVIKILTESEDHSKRGEYKILLGSEPSVGDPADSSRDYPTENVKAKAPSYAGVSGNEGGPEFAVDGKNNTFWHSRWGDAGEGDKDLTGKDELRYIELQLEEEILADAVRYLPRQSGGSNGSIKDYVVNVSTDGNDWQTVSVGTDWAKNGNWKLAVFDKPTNVKYIRLYGKSTHGDSPNKFISAAEVRVRKAQPKIDISNAKVQIKDLEFDYTGFEIKPRPTKVIFEGKELKYGVDYAIDYENNKLPGVATLSVRGIVNYTGKTEPIQFTIKPVELIVSKFDVAEVKTYRGVEPDMPKTVMGHVNIGPEYEFEVEWDRIKPEQYNKVGSFEVKGKVKGQSIRPTAVVTVLGPIDAHDITTVTATNVSPILPDIARVYFTDGESKDFPVTWDKFDSSDFSKAGSLVTVKGSVTVNNSEMEKPNQNLDTKSNTPIETIDVYANVRVADGEEKNIAIDKFAMTSHGDTNNDYPRYINNGKRTESLGGAKEVWTDWERDTYHNDGVWVGVVLDESAKIPIDSIKIGFISEENDSANAVRLPSDYKVQYYTGDTYDYNKQSPASGRNWQELGNDDNWKDINYSQKDNIAPEKETFLDASSSKYVKASLDNEKILDENNSKEEDVLLDKNNSKEEDVLLDKDNSKEEDALLDKDNSKEEDALLDKDNSKEEDRLLDEDNSKDDNTISNDKISADNSEEILSSHQNNVKTPMLNYNFEETVNAGAVRVLITPQQNQWVGVDEFEVYGNVVEAHNDFTIESIKLNDKDIKDDFDSNNNFVYTLKKGEKLPKLEAKISDGVNASLTVIQPSIIDGKGIVHITSEDNKKDEIYTINFDMEQQNEIYHTVTFDTNGGSKIDSVKIESGAILDAPSVPTRSGYNFGGWYEDKNCTIEYKFDKPVLSDLTLYAYWIIQTSGSSIGSIGPSKPDEKPKYDISNPSTDIPVLVVGKDIVIKDTDGKDIVISLEEKTSGFEVSIEKDGNNIGKIKNKIPVSIPTNQKSAGTVAIVIDKDGNKTVIKDSYLKDGNMVLNIDKSCQIVIENLAMTFNDVNINSWFKDSVDFVTARKLFAGTNEYEFSPNENMTRGMLASVLYRLEYEPEVYGNIPFADVNSQDYYSNAIVWATQNNFVSGMSPTEFAPNESITREQLASILYRYAGSPKFDRQSKSFTDESQISNWASDAVYWAVENNVLSGRVDGSLDPKGNATRAEVSSMFMRIITK